VYTTITLELGQSFGIVPYQIGVIGSTDAYTSLPSAEENNFHGKVATYSIPEKNDKNYGKISIVLTT